VTPARLALEIETALAAADAVTLDAGARAQRLLQIASGLQQRPGSPDHIAAAIGLYDRALDACPAEDLLLRARIMARQASAFQTVPGPGMDALEAARGRYESALPDLRAGGRDAEVAEVEMNLGLVLQSLAGVGRARLSDAIAAYRRALRVFDAQRYPVEYAIVQSNLVTALLSSPTGDTTQLRDAQMHYEDAYRIFVAHGETEKATLLADVMAAFAEAGAARR
jgi:tetratricopeptide (TPR) repeat protein